jgi:predicted nucleic acid-binding protein
MLYLDTSAFLKLHVREAGSEAVQKLVVAQSQPLPVWDTLEMEFANALWLKVFWKEIKEADARRQLVLFEDRRKRGQYFTAELSRSRLLDRFRVLAARTPETGCRTMDVMHVAAALELEAVMLVSFDERQRRLAELAGLRCQPIK